MIPLSTQLTRPTTTAPPSAARNPTTTIPLLTHQAPSNSTAMSVLNSKTATLCTNAKAAGIRIYTITFGVTDTTANTLMTNCARLKISSEVIPCAFAKKRVA